jgi:hypothetical protein
VGLPSRRAQAEAEIVHQSPDRYLQKKVGGVALVSGQARDIAEAFDRRGRRLAEGETGGAGRPSAKTEASIESGLDFFARNQNSDGSWSFDYARGRQGMESERVAIHSDTAATGLVLLAYFGAGYDHFDDKHQQRLASALNFLLSHQKENGDLYIPQHQKSNEFAQFYSHGIATIALCEAFGMTGDPKLGEAAQKAIDFIVASQHNERGGWRYSPAYQSDVSVGGWMVMALKSGQLAGLKVPEKTFEGITKFLDKAQAPGDASKFVYNPYAPNTARARHGRQPSTVMTAVGQLSRLYLGWNRDTPEMKRGADHLLANLPTLSSPARIGTIENPMRDTYYWYYATQVMFHMKGEYWRSWNETLHPLLTDSQVATGAFAGSWDPRTPVPDRWGPQCGRIYVTAMNILSLEVYYRHLPIYEETLK